MSIGAVLVGELVAMGTKKSEFKRFAAELEHAGLEPRLLSSATEFIEFLVKHPECERLVTDHDIDGLPPDRWLALLEKHFSRRPILVRAPIGFDTGRFVHIPAGTDMALILTHLERNRSW